jgi:predicted Fe-S protein YdhL (DUF1289 family)
MAATYHMTYEDYCERICIDHRDNICSTCAKPYTHRKMYQWKDEDDKTIKEVLHITAHPSCRSITRQIKEHEQKILDLEFKLFVLKTS